MYSPLVEYDPKEFITTPSGVKVSRKATIASPENVEMPGGKSIIQHGVLIEGNLSNITISKYCYIDEASKLTPSSIPDSMVIDNSRNAATTTYVPMHIGKYTKIGKDCQIQAASIGLGCRIGNRCIISNRAILKDHVHVCDDAVIPADTVIPPFSIVSGVPAKIVGELPESAPLSTQFESKQTFSMFKPKTQ